MNTEAKTKLVLAGVLAGASTLVNISPLKAMSTPAPAESSVRQVVSKAALRAIEARVQKAGQRPGVLQEGFLQITKGGGTFAESGPEFVESWRGQMRLP